ncbi:MAG: hypothetical protein ACRCZP_11595 [Phycicoccus sp.]
MLVVRDRVAVAAVCLVVAAWLEAATFRPGRRWVRDFRGRRWVSASLIAVGGWGVIVTAADWSLVGDVVMLAVLGAFPAVAWWMHTSKSRTRPDTSTGPELTGTARRVLDQWGTRVAGDTGPVELRGSHPIVGTVGEPADGAVTMIVRVVGVHPADVTGSAVRRAVEVALGLPMDSAAIDAIRDDGAADRVRVTLTTKRHLERATAPWPGPVLDDDGWMPVAMDAAGRQVAVRLHDEDGVKHGMIGGAAGGGKSGTSAAVVAPGVLAGREIMIYLDGGGGSSNALMTRLATVTAFTPAHQRVAVAVVRAIVEHRKAAWAAAGRDRYRAGADPEPIISLVIDEANLVGNVLTDRHQTWVQETAQLGRKLGVRVIQISQGFRADQVVGDIPARNQLAGTGFVIAHRAGGRSDAQVMTDGLSVPGVYEALLALPPVPGMAVIAVGGEVKARQARVFHVAGDLPRVLDEREADGWTPLQMTGVDDRAARTVEGWPWDPPPKDADGAVVVQPLLVDVDEPSGDRRRTWIVDYLAGVDGPVSGATVRAAMLDEPDAPDAGSPATFYRVVKQLETDGVVSRSSLGLELADQAGETAGGAS